MKGGLKDRILLIFVLLVFGIILGGLLVPKVSSRPDDGDIGSAKSNIKTLASALEAFKLDVGRYPSTSEGLAALVYRPADLRTWRGPYIRGPVPNDPWARPHVYFPKAGGKEFVLESFGADGAPGGEGYAADIVERG